MVDCLIRQNDCEVPVPSGNRVPGENHAVVTRFDNRPMARPQWLNAKKETTLAILHFLGVKSSGLLAGPEFGSFFVGCRRASLLWVTACQS